MAAQQIAQFSSRDGVEELFVNSDTFTLLAPNPSLQIYVYVGTTFAVMAAYALLLLNSIRYIKVVVIPAIMLAFVGALWRKFWFKKGRSQHRNNPTANLGGKALRLLPMVLVSYGLQLIQLACTHVADLTNGQQSGSFVISHFLLFFSSALGALAVMMAALPIGTSRGVLQAQQALHRIFTVILVIAVHTMASEWMEEDMLLVCMPGLITALVWFTVNFDHGGCTLSVNKVTSPRATTIVLVAAATLVAYLAPKFAYETKVLATNLYRRILCSCTLSGVLSYFSMWMIRQWPGRTDSAMVLIQLLEFSANICFGISAMVLIKPISSLQDFAADAMRLRLRQWVLSEPTNILNLEVTIYSILCISIACMSKFHDCVSGRIKLCVAMLTVVLSSLFTQSLVQKFIKQSRDSLS